MGIFSAIMDKLRHHSDAGQDAAQQTQQQPGMGQQSGQQGMQQADQQPGGQQQARQPAMQQQSASSGGQAPLQNVDVDAVLSQLAQKKGGGGNYRSSIVDLLKLLDLDSSLQARKDLANELGVHAGADGSAEQNIALQKAVMRKLAENGGKVPDDLRH